MHSRSSAEAAQGLLGLYQLGEYDAPGPRRRKFRQNRDGQDNHFRSHNV